MIVKGGTTFSNNQGAAKKSRQPSTDSKSFNDLLMGNHKKKNSMKLSKKAVQTKRKSNEDIADDNPNVSKRKDVPVKKKAVSTQRRSDVEKVQAQKERPAQRLENKSVERQQPIVAKTFAGQGEKGTETVDSLNLSGNENKTLDKNQKIMQSLESSFEEVMTKSQLNKMNQQATQNINKNSLGVSANMASPTQGKMNIDPEMTLGKPGETLALGMGEGLAGLKVTSKDNGAATSGDSSTNLDSMFNQQIEQDMTMGEAEGTQFVEEMSLAQNDGKAQKLENMQSIVKQARVFVDDGGGSMEIHLQPEGLGKVHLKVAVNEGNVNVEMMTNNPAAKKALEEGLLDIRTALEGQKLLVETLKVEMSPDYQKDFSDMQQHMQEQANRDFAEQFLDQFQRGREERVSGMFDSFKNFDPGSKEQELTLSRRNSYAENGKGRSVNLVA